MIKILIGEGNVFMKIVDYDLLKDISAKLFLLELLNVLKQHLVEK